MGKSKEANAGKSKETQRKRNGSIQPTKKQSKTNGKPTERNEVEVPRKRTDKKTKKKRRAKRKKT